MISNQFADGKKVLTYKNNSLIYYKLNDEYEFVNEKIICQSINLNLDFKISEFNLRPFPFYLSMESVSKNDYKFCCQKLSSTNPYGYGFVKWDANEMCISQFYYGDRCGLGCYRWPNGDEYYGHFRYNKVDGLGVFYRKNMYELGVYTAKKKNGVFFDITDNIIYIRRYSEDIRLKEELQLDLSTFNIVRRLPNGTYKYYYFDR